MKIRILPILLLMGFLIFGLTQTDPTQANAVQTNNSIVAANDQSAFTPALAITTPFFTTPNITTTVTAEARTPGISVSPTVTTTISPSATSLNAALNIEKGASSIGPAFEKFLQEAGATAPTPDNLEAAEVDVVEDISQPVAASQTQVESDYGKFDLSRLRIVNLLPATDRVASLDGASAVKTVNVSSQLQLGSSGVIPDDTAKILAAETDAPKLWPVKGPVTSTFGPRQTLEIPATTDSANGKGGAGPTLTTALGQTTSATTVATTPTPTTAPEATLTTAAITSTTAASPTAPTPTATPTTTANATATSTPAAAITPTPTPTTAVTTTAPATAIPKPTAPLTTAVSTATPTVTATISPTAAGLTPIPATPTPEPSATPNLTPTPTATNSAPITATAAITATPGISATVTVSPTVTPTATPWPSGPIPTINGFLPAVGADEEYHTGLDIAVPEGTQVEATADGVVLYAGDGGGYGRVVFIQHAGGFVTVYGHNSKLLVSAGQTVKAGQVISLSGSTGYSTGPHVHYEVRYNGKIADPAYFLGLEN